MTIIPADGEVWLAMKGWPYEVSRLGHVRRKRARKQVQLVYDKQGFATVELKRGQHKQTFDLDTLVVTVFNGNPRGPEARPLHLDGLAWNNLRWGLKDMPGETLVTDWIAWRAGKRLHGPMNDWSAIVGGCQPGDVIVGHDRQRRIVSFEIMFSRNRAMSPRNPFDLADEYRAAAKMHSNDFWSVMLSEAAEVIDSLAANVLERVTSGKMEQVALPAKRRPVDTPTPPRQQDNPVHMWPITAVKPPPPNGKGPPIQRRPINAPNGGGLQIQRRPMR